MNKKQLIKLIKSKADNTQINDHKNDIASQIDNSYQPIHEEIKPKRKAPWFAISFALVATSLLIVTIFSFMKDKGNGGSGITLDNSEKLSENSNSQDENNTSLADSNSSLIDSNISQGEIEELSRAKQMLSYEVYALGNTLSDHSSLNSLKRSKNQNNVNDNQAKIKSVSNQINDFLLTGEMLNDKTNFQCSIYVNNNANFSQYDYMMVTQYENEKSYIMYYTEEPVDSNHRKDKIDNVNSNLTGVLVYEDGLTYNVNGSKSVHSKFGVEELTTKLTVFLSDNEYLVIKQETEIDENEFEYSYYQDSILIESKRISFEEENGKKEMKIEIRDEIADTKQEYRFFYHGIYIDCRFKDETISHDEIKVRIIDNDENNSYDYYYPFDTYLFSLSK